MKMSDTIEQLRDTAALKAFLASVDLPIADIAPSSTQIFFGVGAESQLQGAVGIELCGSVALLRSLAVDASCRGLGLGSRLVRFAEDYAARHGASAIYLLTVTAENYFAKLGYGSTSRADAPSAISGTAQFTGLCPVSSAFLSKALRA